MNEEGHVTIIGRLLARNGSGADYPASGANQGIEGKLVQQGDITSIIITQYDSDGDTTAAAGNPITMTVSSVISDTIVATGVYQNIDNAGGNFLYDVLSTWCLTPGTFNLKIVVTLTSGETISAVINQYVDAVPG